MPRRPRVILPNVPQHIIQRGNNRQVCFYADEDYQIYLQWLQEYADKTECNIHAYVLMTNHVHLLFSTDKTEAVGAMMKALGQRYVQYITKPISAVAHYGKGVINRAPRKQKPIYWLASPRRAEE